MSKSIACNVDNELIGKLNRIIEEDCKQIATLVNTSFESCREYMKAKILAHIRKILTPVPPHYVWRHDGCPYDSSGVLDKDGFVSLNQTISQFLENEYTGYSEATYVSGCGLRWCNWGDNLADEIRDICWAIMQQVIIKYLSEKIGRSITDEELSFVNTDPVYDLCYASDFFLYEPAIKFVGLEDTLLLSLIV